MASSSTDGDDLRTKTQQSPLASQRAKEAGVKRDSWFPLSFREGFSQWWADVPAATAEHNVLSFIPYITQAPTQIATGTKPPSQMAATEETPDETAMQKSAVKTVSSHDPYGTRRWSSELVPLQGKNRALNEFSVERSGETVDQNLVMLHGYGAGLGFYYKNFEGLSRVPGWKVYALDLLGMGRSSRPPFKLKGKDRQACISEAEDWFIDALEEWRIKRNLDKFTLLAHSLGGYMGVAYALKYPGHLNKLVLASPVGVPEDPRALTSDMPDPAEIDATNADLKSSGLTSQGDNNNFLNAKKKAEMNGQKRKPLPRWFTYLWDANISPFSLVRNSGPLGPRFVSGWTSRRFSHLGPEEARALHTYAYTLFKQRGSGEYALAYILAPGAFARSPLIRRIAGVGRQYVRPDGSTASTIDPDGKKEHGFPIVFIYGSHDWMDTAGGYDAVEKLKAAKETALANATAEDARKERGSAKVVVVKDAGHHVYLDNWESFNDVMRREMMETSKLSDVASA